MEEPRVYKKSEARRKSNMRFDSANTIKYYMKLNIHTDAALIEFLTAQPNKQGVLKQALREYIENHEA